MNQIVNAAKAICNGENISMKIVSEALRRAGEVCAQKPYMVKVTGYTIVIGPLRGHASDFAHYILTTILLNEEVENIVLLGNYIDGAHQSIEVLYLVALLVSHSGKNVVPLLGKHELIYPIQPKFFGSLQNELILRSINSNTSAEVYEEEVQNFFFTLPIVCVIDELLFCVSGGLASGFRLLSQIEVETSREALLEFVVNSRMSEPEEMVLGKNIFVASHSDRSFFYTFNAACNFISRNNLAMLIVGMEYHTNCPDKNDFTRPNHNDESIYFPGYVIDKIHPEMEIPAVISIFSAPCFCGNNRNNACILEIFNRCLKIRELKMYNERPLIMPGNQNHAFSWAQPMLENAVLKVAQELISGSIPQQPLSKEEEDYCNRERHAKAKMRRMCQLLKFFNIPLPKFPWS
ncbi:unnamed protein product [Phytomonas sp. Hart1]|nr:unnamed protein product [Phytomonas sp. Hart1]|eukprot:CCW66652.1 unnamed protein product [Phytomonas sp. isolate Hart1]